MNILTYPNPILEQKAKKIKNPTNSEIKKLIKEMIETMRANNGLGLAAPQIGKSIRLCLIEANKELLVLMNPKITTQSKECITAEEGCLSFPGKFIPVKRAEVVQVRYLDAKGNKNKLKARGLLARAVQHEVDHLNGIVFINK